MKLNQRNGSSGKRPPIQFQAGAADSDTFTMTGRFVTPEMLAPRETESRPPKRIPPTEMPQAPLCSMIEERFPESFPQ